MPPDLHQLYDAHAPALFAFLINFTRREADARDVLQELFLKLAARPERLAGIREARAYLLRLAHHLAIDAYRRRATHEAAVERAAIEPVALFVESADPDEAAFRAALAGALVKYLARNPGQVVPFAHFVRGLSPAREALADFLFQFLEQPA